MISVLDLLAVIGYTIAVFRFGYETGNKKSQK